MSDHELQVREVFLRRYRDGEVLTRAIDRVFNGVRRTFYNVPQEERDAIEAAVKEQVAREVEEADAAFLDQRNLLNAEIMREALLAELDAIIELRRIITDSDESALVKVNAAKEIASVLRNGIKTPERAFTPELPKGELPGPPPTPQLQAPAMYQMPMPSQLGEVKELRVTSQDGTVLTVTRPTVVEQSPQP